MKRMRVLVAMAGIAAAIGLAAPAYADDGTDAAFLSALSNAGLSHKGSAVPAGHAVCQLMDSGVSASDTIVAVQSTNPGFTLQHAAQFTAISASAYCPNHL